MYRGIKPKSRRTLEEELKSTNNQLQQYRTQVSDHFSHTATLVSKLTTDYATLHDYLSASAVQLGNLDIQPSLIRSYTSEPGNKLEILNTQQNPPLDYAARRSNVGTLSESYGLEQDHQRRPPIVDGYSESSK